MNSAPLLCPSCQHPDSRIIDEFLVSTLCREYLRQLKVDVQSEFPRGVEALLLRECSRCGLQYFDPLITGSQAFYSKLSGHSEYYARDRWEFERARSKIPADARVLDIGCGDGFFLSILPQGDKVGLEFNPEAVASARKAGLDVRQEPLESMPDNFFDVVTLFHVLEHLGDPSSLLREVVRLLKGGGLLIVSVPNNDSFIGADIFNIANAPPHHPLRWRPKALTYLATIFPLKLQILENEPLSPLHLFLYRRVILLKWIERCTLTKLPLMRGEPWPWLASKAANRFTLLVNKVKPRPPRNPKTGFSVLAVFERHNEFLRAAHAK